MLTMVWVVTLRGVRGVPVDERDQGNHAMVRQGLLPTAQLVHSQGYA